MTSRLERPIIKRNWCLSNGSVMQAITSHLAPYLLLIHMVLGCCFHHAHACERECCTQPEAIAHACECSSHDNDVTRSGAELAGVVGDLPQDRHDQHQHQCEGDQCRFVGVERASEQDHELNLGIRSLSLSLANQGSDEVGKTIVPGFDQSHSIAGFSLRAHLQLRVLLI